MRRQPTDHKKADILLTVWASNVERAMAHGYMPCPLYRRVQNGESGESSPERFQRILNRHASLDWAVNRVKDQDRRWWSVLWAEYVNPTLTESGRPDIRRMAEDFGVCERTWRRWRKRAKAEFLRAYEGRNLTENRQVLE